jgi:methylenetetrahydrofolate dehydrogenase (NADP+) / methenyltetrahydrofolate cyclohydrolase
MVKYIPMNIFDGIKLSQEKKAALKLRADALLEQGIKPKIAACLYTQDVGSQLYTGIKKELAKDLGIGYETFEFDIAGGVELVLKKIEDLNNDENVTGIILQKPTRQTWAEHNHVEGDPKNIKKAFNLWWGLQTEKIVQNKDVDGLHPSILELIKDDKLAENKRVMPATARAVLAILDEAKIDLKGQKIIILGKSDLLGKPLLNYFLSKKVDVDMIGSAQLKERQKTGKNLLDSDVIISATGRPNLITTELIKEGAVIIDVGEPYGDVDFESVKNKAEFITPVPGGVGPMTVVSLMENCLDLVE